MQGVWQDGGATGRNRLLELRKELFATGEVHVALGHLPPDLGKRALPEQIIDRMRSTHPNASASARGRMISG
jgi:hypothetical protein